ncbi:class I SAM-dependent methyltransferase [Salmonirosea aquatica]|uniref:Methyltransferase domain-containing protein n=1 Tax=Salmonirosea aquatica TaxID=2654236 RepID=A0A7C9FP84_9BACT|nr:methyltransferase domain-containing protein [Cytophagaceae bacterium SJW1-29]
MIDNRAEYERMYEVERSLWWYQILHDRIFHQIRKTFGPPTPDLKILDAACGTGGLLSYLHEKGYSNLTGFDFSPHAIDFSRERGLDVGFGDLRQTENFRPREQYDVIICNDALYFLTDAEIKKTLSVFRKRLTENGMVLINIHAFSAFAGTHDVAVGSTRRFTWADFKSYAQAAGLRSFYHTYWPFLLSLPILAVRQWQRHQLRRGRVPQTVESDVRYPGDLINGTLRFVTRAEQALLRSAPFGSSLFLVMKGT